MKIVALDTSGLVASVAVAEDGVVLAQYSIQYKKTHSQTMLPMLASIKEMIELDLKTVDAVAIAGGPGSFTGLRIGAGTAKGLAYALHVPIVAVPTLEGLAYHFWGTDKLVCPLMDARRMQVYTGIYAFTHQGDQMQMEEIFPPCAVELAVILEQIQKLDREVIFLGDGVAVYLEQIKEAKLPPYLIAPPHKNAQSAANIAVLASRYATQATQAITVKSQETHDASHAFSDQGQVSAVKAQEINVFPDQGQVSVVKAQETNEVPHVFNDQGQVSVVKSRETDEALSDGKKSPIDLRQAQAGVLRNAERVLSAAEFVPQYYRLSQAERERRAGLHVRIRKLELADVEQVSKIEAQSFSMPWSAADFADLAQEKDALYYVATANEEIIGCGGASVVVGEAYINNVVVMEKYR
ncbi:MAG: tRNA (adenosine(37)-N6)-threonylcarbamoyltransferase complex dimerization subunit type 1 TsaB, partial [Lachnospiraceae bacterium]|nr:tRNA (adenosine(37)-N6)-threonylcarbamoyltransferase complex dimerization subunit type 1 TsaB [Lachnospiraceae bacterium]